MKPALGRYRLTTTTPPTSSIVTVDATGMDTTFGRFEWDPIGGVFVLPPSMVVECKGDGTFIAVWGNRNYEGTCVALP